MTVAEEAAYRGGFCILCTNAKDELCPVCARCDSCGCKPHCFGRYRLEDEYR